MREVFDNVKLSTRVSDVRKDVKRAILSVADSVEGEESDYIRQHADGFCAEAFKGQNGQKIVQDPDRMKDQAIGALSIVYTRLYGST